MKLLSSLKPPAAAQVKLARPLATFKNIGRIGVNKILLQQPGIYMWRKELNT